MAGKSRKKASFDNSFATSVYGTIVLGIFVNAIWARILDPGLSWGTNQLARVTGGFDGDQQQFRDIAFELSSYEPIGVFGGLLMTAMGFATLALIPFVIVYFCIGKQRVVDAFSIGWNYAFQTKSVTTAVREIQEDSSDGATWAWFAYFSKLIVYLIFVYFLTLLASAFGLIGQGLFIRSAVQADLTACAPYISAGERMRVASEFAQLRSEEDFKILVDHLKEIAKQNHVALKSASLVRVRSTPRQAVQP